MDAFIPASMSLGAFGMMMPRLPDVRSACPGDSISADVRVGEFASATIILTIGAVVAIHGGNKSALKIALLIVIVMISIYEIVLRMNPGRGED